MPALLPQPPPAEVKTEDQTFRRWFYSVYVKLNSLWANQYTVAALPVAPQAIEGMQAYATNGRKVGEGVGAGTGVPVYYSALAWRVFSTDAAVVA